VGLNVRDEILTAMHMKITVLLDVTPCSLVKMYDVFFYPADGCGKFLRNVDTFVPHVVIA
jgi:hypothetical protein